MADISIDPEWVTDYARRLERASEDLGEVGQSVHVDGVGAETFGELGVEVGTDTAYAEVRDHLDTQLARGREVLLAASVALRNVARVHLAHDEDSAAELNRSGADPA
ncbi:hypothetical protein C1701_13460 [Actinoalloteichus sp. AHMU CJ021]|uniref:Uncharacterized protein n=1 Tax=Actinoalloteichus caeruleus DSM 43889 TaxID=1120930 RepID=A0ABT1JLR4_ACTCY|nr:hypothetical protein [Actinoalloteichus caeruleus]AUS79200.1 hypothetical protein C1701_13460 [Actinoalloteichus sp. AHMU CJ021]MCP2333453.1 hypothetical protein [Actinoalloteichus caeruleus DSM 43889]